MCQQHTRIEFSQDENTAGFPVFIGGIYCSFFVYFQAYELIYYLMCYIVENHLLKHNIQLQDNYDIPIIKQ